MRRRPFTTWLVLCLSAAAAAAQAPPGPLPPKPGVVAQKAPPPIRVKVDLVTTPVTVRSAAGGMLLKLEARDFRLYDNGVEQKIERFEMGNEPITAALLFETSSRIEPMLPALRRTGIVFTQNLLGPRGQAAVFSFDDDIALRQPLTDNHEQLEAAVRLLRLGTSGARLHDALLHGVTFLSEQPQERRRVLVVVAEAHDTGSETQLGEVLRAAHRANVTIYSVGLSTTAALLRSPPDTRGPVQLSPPGTFGRPPIPGTVQTPTTEAQRDGNINLLAGLAYLLEHLTNATGYNDLVLATEGTGGQHFPTFKDRTIESAISEIGGELHAQYALSYFPAGVKMSGHHQIEVRVTRRELKVRARPGYYIPPPDESK
jgi:VWFA-related protein